MLSKSLPLAFIMFLTSVGLSAQNEQLTAFIKAKMTEKKIPGMQVAVVQHGAIVFNKSFGIANLQDSIPVYDHSIFAINSCTKAFTAVAVMQLVEAGQIDLEAPVATYLPGLPSAWQSVKINQLMSHISGIPDISPVYDNLPDENNNGQSKEALAAEAIYALNHTRATISQLIIHDAFMSRIFLLFILIFLSSSFVDNVELWDKEQSSWTPLMKLAYVNDTVMIKELIANTISINLQSKYGWTALKVASKKGLVQTVGFLLRNGADANLSDKDKMTPLMEAALHNEKAIAVLLLKSKADPNRKNKTGWTALMGATSFADIEMMKILLDAGADVNARQNVDGSTALDLAKWGKGKDKIGFLINSGAK